MDAKIRQTVLLQLVTESQDRLHTVIGFSRQPCIFSSGKTYLIDLRLHVDIFHEVISEEKTAACVFWSLGEMKLSSSLWQWMISAILEADPHCYSRLFHRIWARFAKEFVIVSQFWICGHWGPKRFVSLNDRTILMPVVNMPSVSRWRIEATMGLANWCRIRSLWMLMNFPTSQELDEGAIYMKHHETSISDDRGLRLISSAHVQRPRSCAAVWVSLVWAWRMRPRDARKGMTWWNMVKHGETNVKPMKPKEIF